jgi:Tat protein secretion system quality control protein TatD with DNase activity
VLSVHAARLTLIGRQVLEVVAGARGETPESLADAVYANSTALFFPGLP